jgi:hypothetical protein
MLCDAMSCAEQSCCFTTLGGSGIFRRLVPARDAHPERTAALGHSAGDSHAAPGGGFRYDQFWQSQPHGVTTDNFGAGKGLELIPFQNFEVILGVPAWIAHNGAIQQAKEKKHSKPPTDGWADETFLIKYRIISANEEHGN